MTHASFLEALHENFEDHVTRLVYADWLEDQGEDARARFIRLSIELEQRCDHPRQREARKREWEDLLVSHQTRWFGPRPERLHQYSWRGGFVDRLVFDPAARLEEVESVLRRHPCCTLVLRGDRALAGLACSPYLCNVRSLDIGALPGSDLRWFDRLFDSPFLRLVELSLRDPVDDHLTRYLGEAPRLQRLRALRLQSAKISDAGLASLMRRGVFPNLEHCHVISNRISWIGLTGLLAAPRAERWTGLSLHLEQDRHWSYGEREQPRFCLRRCKRLRELALHFAPAPVWYTRAMLGSLEEIPLKILTLSGAIRPVEIEQLANWSGLNRLERLQVKYPAWFSSLEREKYRATLGASPFRNPASEWIV